MAPGSTRVELFPAWRETITFGCFAVDDCNVVYKCMPDGGLDAVGRDRYVVHLLMGHRDDLDLAAAGPDCDVWLSASECTVDALPSLAAVPASRLRARQFSHDEQCDHALALDLVEQFRSNEAALPVRDLPGADFDHFVSHLHVVVPTSLWPDVELVTDFTADGLTGCVSVHPRNATGPKPRARAAAAGLAGCAFHEHIDELWSSTQRTSWTEFVDGLTQPMVLSRPGSHASLTGPAEAPSASASAHRETVTAGVAGMRAVVREAIGSTSWDYDRSLDDRGLQRVCGILGQNYDLFARWCREASGSELRMLLGEVDDRRTFVGVRSLAAATPSIELQNGWRRSAAAPLAWVLVGRGPNPLDDQWAVPSLAADAHGDDARRLAKQLIAGDDGHEQCVTLFRRGLIRDGPWRKAMIDGLLDADANRDNVFRRLMVDAGADETILCDVALDHLDAFAAWLNMPPEYREAFRQRLVVKPSLFSRILEHLPTVR